MSKRSDKLEASLACMINNHRGEKLPEHLPSWLIKEGIKPGAIIKSSEGIGSKDRKNKTDVIIFLEDSCPIKISAKLLNADYFGNWYCHNRFLLEFGEQAFKRMTKASTEFANSWKSNENASLFVGVSICFGKRKGQTGQNFTDIFNSKDILTVSRGFGEGNSVANCMYISDDCAKDIPDLLAKIQEINEETVNIATEDFKVAHRPINPLTEYSNRGKCSYTMFQPYKKLSTPKIITSKNELFSLGEFVEVEATSINHNRIIKWLLNEYNIIIPTKVKERKKILAHN